MGSSYECRDDCPNRRDRYEAIMLIVASNLAQFMDSDMPSHAENVFRRIIAERESSPPLLKAYVDMVRPKKAQEILDIRDRLLREPMFFARVKIMAAQIDSVLDNPSAALQAYHAKREEGR